MNFKIGQIMFEMMNNRPGDTSFSSLKLKIKNLLPIL